VPPDGAADISQFQARQSSAKVLRAGKREQWFDPVAVGTTERVDVTALKMSGAHDIGPIPS
jgi:hypothetical protein